MKWMAVGEVGAFLLGIACAVVAVLLLDDQEMLVRNAVFLAIWYLATKCALRFVHLGYSGKTKQAP